MKVGASGTERFVSTNYKGWQRSGLTYPNGRNIAYGFHPDGALKTVGDASSATAIATYDYVGGRVLRRAMQNGIDLDLRDGSGTHYDSAGLPTAWNHRDTNQGGDPVALGFEYAYDGAGNKLWRRAEHDATLSQRFAYDSAGRLTAFVRGAFPDTGDVAADYCAAVSAGGAPPAGLASLRRWTLDGAGNWSSTSTTAAGDTSAETRLDTSFNEYYSVAGAAQTHDANGNLTDDGEQRYVWDAFNRLHAVLDDAGTTVATYAYGFALPIAHLLLE